MKESGYPLLTHKVADDGTVQVIWQRDMAGYHAALNHVNLIGTYCKPPRPPRRTAKRTPTELTDDDLVVGKPWEIRLQALDSMWSWRCKARRYQRNR